MKNIFMILTALLFLTACADDSSNKGSSIDTTPPPTTTKPTVSTSSLTSIIRNTNNSHGDYCVTGISKAAGDTVTLAFEKPEDESKYTVTKGFYSNSAYCFSIASNEKNFYLSRFFITVTNREGIVILDKSPNLIYTINKYFPYNPTLKLPDLNFFDFTTEKTQVIVLEQLTTEYFNTYGDNPINSNTSSSANIGSYSFTNTSSGMLDNTNTDGNFTVDDSTPTFTVDTTSYPNCLISKTTTPCAISVTHSGTGPANASFYIRLNKPTVYPDTRLDFTSK